ncbi:hypothetical protein FRC19_009628 [Serendipita sp. 401]|nr:hypothetical protein FRC19_009628 [Serendipita sp. 401]
MAMAGLQWQWVQQPYVRQLVWVIVPVAAGVVATRYIIQIHRLFAGVGYLPGDRTLLGPNSIIPKMLPYIPFINRGFDFAYRQGYDIFKKYNTDVISRFGFIPHWFSVFVADAAIAREITSNRVAFPKPVHLYKPINIYGTNVVTSEHEEWKVHRRITAPSFSERNNRMVCEEGTRLMYELFDLWAKQGDGTRIEVENAVETTTDFALMVIAAAGFGARFAWDDERKPSAGYKFNFLTALKVVMTNIFFRIAFPDMILGLWKRGRDVRDASRDFRRYMVEMIEARKRQAPEDRRADLLSNLISAAALEDWSVDKSSQFGFGDEELVGNVFIFLFGGHETTAHSLAFTLGLLAAHPDVQQKLYESLKELVSEGGSPTYADIVRWPYGLAVIYEALRLYSPVSVFPKLAAEDSTFVTYSNDGDNTPILITIPKDTTILIDIAAIHRNPKYWKEPNEFRPERFMGDYNRDAFFSFGAGPRSCMGKRFSEIEALTFLANLVLKYRFEGTPLNEKETTEERKARLLRWKLGGLTLYPERLPLTFIRR